MASKLGREKPVTAYSRVVYYASVVVAKGENRWREVAQTRHTTFEGAMEAIEGRDGSGNIEMWSAKSNERKLVAQRREGKWYVWTAQGMQPYVGPAAEPDKQV